MNNLISFILGFFIFPIVFILFWILNKLIFHPYDID